MKILKYLLLMILGWVLVCQNPAALSQTNSGEVKLKDTPISKVRAELKNIFKLRWQDDQLKIDKVHWKTIAEKNRIRDPYASYFRRSRFPEDAKFISSLFHAVTSKLGSRGTSISSSGTAFTRTARSGDLNSTLSADTDFVELKFQEKSKSNQVLSLRISKDGQFRIMLLGGDEMLILEQMKKGKVRIVCDIGNGPRVYVGKSFRDFAKNDTTEMSTELGILMNHIGISKPILPMDQVVKKAVWAKLELLSNSDVQDQFDVLAKQLDAPRFSVRQTASLKINNKYDLFIVAISNELKKQSISPERKSRLRDIIRANSQSNQIADVIRGFELLDSPDYLIRLGQSDPQKKEMKILLDRLRKITKHDAGDQIADWAKWAAANSSNKD